MSRAGTPRGGMGRTTVLAAFRASLAALSTTLETTAAHYVRCIKPNTAQAAGEFDGARPRLREIA